MNMAITSDNRELKRRSIIKALLWRFIGIIWTWTGAYVIILLIPPSWKTAAIIATLIVIYHHSTRMIMYYFYERIWNSISWGKTNGSHVKQKPLSARHKLAWAGGTTIAVIVIFFLIIYVTPLIKGSGH